MRLKAYVGFMWVPVFIVCLLVVPRLLPSPFIPVVIVKAPLGRWRRNLSFFLSAWIALTLFMLAYGMVMGWGAFLLGSSTRDVREIEDLWSLPLGWINSSFIVRKESGFVAVFGIVAANCYFYALAATLSAKIVHALLRSNRTTELGLSRPAIEEDDDDL
ncbi:MAG TPA: hypothetical protein VKZ53_18960 [Candidatus Angelobacter sp.]|nr:hypothetical protein [Candidatus Angelobacter sp.]